MKYLHSLSLAIFIWICSVSVLLGQLHLPWEEVLGPRVSIKSVVQTSDGLFGISDQDLFSWDEDLKFWNKEQGLA